MPWCLYHAFARVHRAVSLTYEQFRYGFTNVVDEDEAAYKLQKHNPAVTEFHKMPDRGHSLVIDHGWREVAEAALTFIAQQLS